MSQVTDKLRQYGTAIFALADFIDAGAQTPATDPPVGYTLPPPPASGQGSWIAPDGTEYTFINHITSSAIGGPTGGYWARVAKPGEGPGAATSAGAPPAPGGGVEVI